MVRDGNHLVVRLRASARRARPRKPRGKKKQHDTYYKNNDKNTGGHTTKYTQIMKIIQIPPGETCM